MGEQWRPLAAEDRIGVVALSGPLVRERFDPGLEGLRSWRNEIVLAPNLDQRDRYLAGSDEARLRGLESVLEAGVRFIVGARGGYGVTRLLDRLPWQRLVEERIQFIGFSDLTGVLNPLVARGGAPQVHGPMVSFGLARQRPRGRLLRLLRGELEGQQIFRFGGGSVVRPGRVQGVALGGNLSILVSLIGTGHEPDLDGAVLFLEEVGEPLYRLDRMLTQLAASGRLNGVKALIGGSLRGCRPFSERDRTWRRLLSEVAPENAVVVVDLPFGHGARNLAFPLGVSVEVDTRTGRIRWSD
jgi:muramoyltetrapeptide carboxypeptidase